MWRQAEGGWPILPAPSNVPSTRFSLLVPTCGANQIWSMNEKINIETFSVWTTMSCPHSQLLH